MSGARWARSGHTAGGVGHRSEGGWEKVGVLAAQTLEAGAGGSVELWIQSMLRRHARRLPALSTEREGRRGCKWRLQMDTQNQRVVWGMGAVQRRGVVQDQEAAEIQSC